MNHQVYGFLQTFVWLDLTFFNAFVISVLGLIRLVCFAAVVEQISNVMTD